MACSKASIKYAPRIDSDADELEIQNHGIEFRNRFCANQTIKIAIKTVNDKMAKIA